MKPGFVVDASLALTWCFRNEETAETKNLLLRLVGESALVPSLWFVELTNVLSIAERKGQIASTETLGFITLIENLDIEVEDDAANRAFTHLLPLCRLHHLSGYDALYLDLSIRREIPLATLDNQLRKAAAEIGVKLLGR